MSIDFKSLDLPLFGKIGPAEFRRTVVNQSKDGVVYLTPGPRGFMDEDNMGKLLDFSEGLPKKIRGVNERDLFELVQIAQEGICVSGLDDTYEVRIDRAGKWDDYPHKVRSFGKPAGVGDKFRENFAREWERAQKEARDLDDGRPGSPIKCKVLGLPKPRYKVNSHGGDVVVSKSLAMARRLYYLYRDAAYWKKAHIPNIQAWKRLYMRGVGQKPPEGTLPDSGKYVDAIATPYQIIPELEKHLANFKGYCPSQIEEIQCLVLEDWDSFE